MNRKDVMEKWDMIFEYMQHGCFGSQPRDIFESIVDGYDEEAACIKAENEQASRDIHYISQILGAATNPKHESGIVYVLDLCQLADETKGMIDRLRTALHEAINRPLGVVPDSALEFYAPKKYTEHVIGTAGDNVPAEIEYRDANGKVVGFWAYGHWHPDYPYQGWK